MKGFCCWFTGLSGSGKSAVAGSLKELLEKKGRRVTVLDGDVARKHLCKGLGFSKEDRDTNIRRIGFVAAQVVYHSGIAVCAAISPYEAAREEVRQMVGPDRFVLIHMNTPLEVCEARDIKGLYKQARRGELKGFTGIDDPYEEPRHADMRIVADEHSPALYADSIMTHLCKKGLLA